MGSLLQPVESTGPPLLDRLKAPFKSKKTWLEIEGLPPMVAIEAKWNPKPLPESGVVCPERQVLFSTANETGSAPWGPEAKGMVVVALRGGTASFEEVALHAEAAGAAAVVLVDNEDKWSTNWVIGRENPPTRQKQP